MSDNGNINTNVLDDKVVLVTGGTGSFGQHFVKIALKSNLKKLIVFSRDELKQSQMASRVKSFKDYDRIRFFLGDVREKERLQRAFNGVDIVVHAAALKQVPALEYNPFEAIKTNILGSQNVIDAAADNNVEKVILISSDKAVNPVNLYGASKLCAEKVFIAGNAYFAKSSKFSVVRYGNVIGSRGSILDVLKEQRKKGFVNLTDERMTRFWITLDGGVRLVLDSLSLMTGGEIFIPQIPSMKVKDLLSAVAPECEVKKIGIRPGEKIHEVLIRDDEVARTLKLGGMFVDQPMRENWSNDHLKGAEVLPQDFVYTSDKNETWLTKKDIKKIMDQG